MIEDFRVERMRAKDGLPNRILLRPKTAFGQTSIQKFSAMLLPEYAKYFDLQKESIEMDLVDKDMAVLSRGEVVMLRFYLGVWAGHNVNEFDLFAAMKSLDEKHLAIIRAWVADPVFP